MKETKKASISTLWILGILSLGLLTGCADIINAPSPALPENPVPGMGRVVVSIGPRLEGARTFMPDVDDEEDLSYTFEFTAEGKDPVPGSITAGIGNVELEEGTWNLRVTGKDAGDTEVLEGRVTGVVITAGGTTNVPVALAAITEGGTGILAYSVTLPDDVIQGTLTVYPWDSETAWETVNLPIPTATIATGAITMLPTGYHRIALDLYKAGGVFHRADIAHIYPGLITQANYTVEAGDFIPAAVNNEHSFLTTVLGEISGLSSGADKVYLLPAIAETMPKTTVSNTNGPVTVTIDGGGKIVTLDLTGGSLLTVGNNVTLVLTNITLRGRGIENEDPDNDAALVTVQSGGTLELGTGARITANKNFSPSSEVYGGGVYVGSNGTFTMNGGEISGNMASSSSSSYGGGVFVMSGIFTMNGGEFSGNMVSSSSSYGGGVYVGSNGTFTMNGGEISGNMASSSSSYSSYGGGVYVSSGYSNLGGEADVGGTFTMSGGEISGNTGGGVYVSAVFYSSGVLYAGGTFTMSGGKISGNTGSGVSVAAGGYDTISGEVRAGGTFTMSGGEISGNISGYGGGVWVGGTFIMNGGKILGNSVFHGGGVDVGSNGTFTMNSGEISGNIATASSPHSRAHGGGVVVQGTFTMTGGEISGNMAFSAITSSTAYGGGVSVSTGDSYPYGTFIMSGGKISGNSASHGGGGVYAKSKYYETSDGWSVGGFTMTGGEISGNTSSGYGGGVYVSSLSVATVDGVYVGETFSMSGGARVNGDNAVYLDTSGYSSVTIGGDFTGPAGSVATIDLAGSASNWLGKAVLKPANGYSGNLFVLKSRFTLGDFIGEPGSGSPITGYVIGDYGTLQSK
jgi:hypothetical protein